MNEQQRNEQAKIKTDLSTDRKSAQDKHLTEKTTEDFAHYFQTTYEPPNIRQARKRGRDKIEVHYDFHIPEKMERIGEGKKFLIRTYGCQMNEHDTEVMAGIFTEMGYEPTTETAEADIILLNTCAIRENAENKVFGELGHLKPLKLENPDLIVGVCGCMSQQESVMNKILQKHQHVDLIFGTHNIHRIPNLIEEAMYSKAQVVEVWSKEGDIIENLPKARHGKIKAWVNIMYGCDKFRSEEHTSELQSRGHLVCRLLLEKKKNK